MKKNKSNRVLAAMRITVTLPLDLLARAKEKARREGTTLTALIVEGLRLVLSETAPEQKQVRLPRVSKARGGLQPGLDWSKLKEYDELAEIEHFRKTLK